MHIVNFENNFQKFSITFHYEDCKNLLENLSIQQLVDKVIMDRYILISKKFLFSGTVTQIIDYLISIADEFIENPENNRALAYIIIKYRDTLMP